MSKEFIVNLKNPKDTAREIADKLNTLSYAVDASVIKGVATKEEHEKLGKKIDKYMEGEKERFDFNDQRWHGGGISEVAHDTSLTGKGTVSSPLSVVSSGTGITSINTDATAAQTLAVGTTGTDFALVNNGTGTHTFNLPTASATNRGALSSTDWTTFNSKGSGTVTSVASADASVTITNPNTTVDLAVAKSPKLTTARTIAITGDLAYTSPSFDGTGNVTASGTLATVNLNVGTFGSATQSSVIIVNGKGLLTGASGTTITPAVGSSTGLGTGVATFLATPTSANLASALTDETGSGAAVFGTNPTIAKPVMNATNPTAQTYSPSIGGTATLDLSLSNQHYVTFPAGNITLALSNDTNNQIFYVTLTQDSGGSRTVTWFTTIKWAGGTTPTLTTTANKRDAFGFVRTGSGTYDGFIIGQNL